MFNNWVLIFSLTLFDISSSNEIYGKNAIFQGIKRFSAASRLRGGLHHLPDPDSVRMN
jgi:hypothetical protein